MFLTITVSTEAAGKTTPCSADQTLRGHDLSGQGQGLSEGAKDGCFAFFSVVSASRYPQISTQTCSLA